MASTTPPPHIALLYSLFLLYVEPLMAFNGAILCHFNPTSFLNHVSASATYTLSSQVIYDQLAATYVLFAFNEAIVLRITNDLRVWRAIIAGILICDILHLYSMWLVMGPELFLDPRRWRAEDWVVLGTLWFPVVLRSAFLMGVGVKEGKRDDKKDL